MIDEIFIRKTKKGYEAYDRNGNVAFGSTKQLAINCYRLMYDDKSIITGQFDMSQIDKKFPG